MLNDRNNSDILDCSFLLQRISQINLQIDIKRCHTFSIIPKLHDIIKVERTENLTYFRTYCRTVKGSDKRYPQKKLKIFKKSCH